MKYVKLYDELLKKYVKLYDELLKKYVKLYDELLKKYVKLYDELLKKYVKLYDELLKKYVKLYDELLKKSVQVDKRRKVTFAYCVVVIISGKSLFAILLFCTEIIMQWDRKKILSFIDKYKERDILWDPTHPEHYHKIKKEDAWMELAEEVGCEVEQCKQKMTSLLASLRREKQKIKASTGTGKENHIDVQLLHQLTDSELKELVPSVGQRKRLKTKINELNSVVVECESDLSSASTSAVSSCSGLSRGEIVLNDPDYISNDEEIAPIISNSYLRPQLPDFDLNTLLQTSPLGKCVLNYYKANQSLDNSNRSRLVDIITKHLYTYIINYRLNENDYLILGAKICSLFSNEVVGTYYVRGIKKRDSRNGKSVLPKGKLVSKVNNLIHLCGEAIPLRKKRSTIDTTDEVVSKKKKIEGAFEQYNNNNDVLWLKHNVEPWQTAFEKWEATYDIRRAAVFSTISDFIAHWPIIKDLRSEILVNHDFDRLYPGCGLNFFLHWERLFEIVLKLNQTNIKDDESITLLKTWKTTENEDAKRVLELLLLPRLIPPKGRSIIAKTHWKHSILEVTESIILHVTVFGEIKPILEKKRNKLVEFGLTLQPMPIFVEPNLANITHNLVSINNILYEVPTPLNAIDTTFSVIHALDAYYPQEAEQVWYVLQKGEECRKRWTQIRDNYRKALKSRTTKSGQAANKNKPIRFAKELEFMREFLGERTQISNIQPPEPVQDSTDGSINIDDVQSNVSETPPLSPMSSSSRKTAKRTSDTPQSALMEYLSFKKANLGIHKADHLTKYFQSLEETVRTFSPRLQIEAKARINKIIHDLELTNLADNSQSAVTPLTNPLHSYNALSSTTAGGVDYLQQYDTPDHTRESTVQDFHYL
ncbi:hypothetical protein FQR65_LT18285 [Abscondita terminalis]|nr:hypothetical protein FQR65_LT18285 [Abscondita terminalis]